MSRYCGDGSPPVRMHFLSPSCALADDGMVNFMPYRFTTTKCLLNNEEVTCCSRLHEITTQLECGISEVPGHVKQDSECAAARTHGLNIANRILIIAVCVCLNN